MKEFIKESHHLNQLKKLHEKLANSIKKRIERDIHFIKKGIQGEANVAYELAHSLQPMLCLYDIRLDYVGYQIQVDYIIITKTLSFY
ncbi:NERD domain-containing protein [Cerasibacillus terrae]|uniref:NERD domain-containing protein n=1 Tax=Cerasibacillus terrae TaxID=2498845 RepID=A0A5C8NRZ7_9BACI|nr:NERD domain-containing protein [Cerasibacillus terrae]TXL64471.1 NERD domain-containing protein [Cerasibacillus terrae]